MIKGLVVLANKSQSSTSLNHCLKFIKKTSLKVNSRIILRCQVNVRKLHMKNNAPNVKNT